MKKFLLSAFAISVFSIGFSQECFRFDGGVGQGFTGGQGVSVGSYDNPDKNGCGTGNFTDDYGLVTPGVGGNNPGNIKTPTLMYGGSNFVNFTFKLYVFDASLKCATNQQLPCETRAQAYIVDPTFNSNTAPTGSQIIAASNLILVSALGGTNNLFFTLNATQQAYLDANPNYKIYLDLQADNCNQGGLKYVFDDFCIRETDPAPLPVTFRSFSATRSKQNVGIKWETEGELNNKGFHIQRKIAGDWENIAFVFSAANGGNSSTVLSYSFTDVNPAKGVTQYRIVQVDLDGRAKASEIRSVRGEGLSKNLLIYPNPSLNGKVSVVFDENNATRNVVVSDMSGRIVKQFRNITTNNLSIENLETGVYSIQVTDLSTAEVSVEKVIVKKR